MDIQYKGYIEDEIIMEMFEQVLERFGIEEHKKEISRAMFIALEDFFMENPCAC